jgi:hypothetical protein
MLGEQVTDALGVDGGLVVHPPWLRRASPQRPPCGVTAGGELDGVLLGLARHECPPPRAVGLGSANLGLGASMRSSTPQA